MNHNGEMTHCLRGHEFTKDNTYTNPRTNQRSCRTCRNISNRIRSKTPSHIAYTLIWNAANKEKRRYTERKSWFKHLGWTPEAFDKTLVEQNNRCGICGMEFVNTPSSRPHADHKHIDPPKPRGILCGNCNWGLGNFKDDVEVLAKAIAYLNKHS